VTESIQCSLKIYERITERWFIVRETKCIAIVLAGGEGKRLGNLTHQVPKPALNFGGKHRIIDFTLSNCINSGIQKVLVLTQNHHHILNSYLLNHWGSKGISIRTPDVSYEKNNLYKGTADAVYQNINEIDQYNPDHIFVLSGDHIYNMDYRRILHSHVQKSADATICAFEVTPEEAKRFGVLTVDKNMRITDFTEKPDRPGSSLVSMGVYLISWQVLRHHLLKDHMITLSSHDFGKDVIPSMINSMVNLYATIQTGYWEDVGTLYNLWKAHMDVLKPNNTVFTEEWPILAEHDNYTYCSNRGEIRNSILNDSCTIKGTVVNSILYQNIEIGLESIVTDSVILPDVKVGRGVLIKNSIVAQGSTINDFQTIIDNYSVNSASANKLTVMSHDH
jgi:glucose-1-phosphate adenylyltransferase